ncbi:MAG: radical SAM family heme chaperone HemW [Gemmatimonadetes bacterium]|nr:radical SAM family heme chaperone HemW [Gemmatimonadota bacterium]
MNTSALAAVRVLDPPPVSGAIRSVYVHAPFCTRRCFYCDFAVKVASADCGAWLSALGAEVRALEREGAFVLDDTLDTLYVGGGTPSLLGPLAMEGLLNLIGEERLQNSDLEWTAEANPESFTKDVAIGWRCAGVNRISLGIQSFHAPSLRWMGRLHGADGARDAVRIGRAAGFSNLSVDLIFGLPDHLERDWERDLDDTLSLDPDHVSLYGLTAEPATPLGRAVAEGRETLSSEGRYEHEYLLAVDRLTEAGYEAYEVSNFARPGFASRHNTVYWSGEPYLGLGNGAHSYRHPVRRWNLRDWDAYRARAEGSGPHAYRAGVEGSGLPVDDEEKLDVDQVRLERIWLGLRTRRGISLQDLPASARDRARCWVENALAVAEGNVVRLTPRGWLVMDRLTVELDANFEE